MKQGGFHELNHEFCITGVAGRGGLAMSYTVTIGSTTESLLAPLTLPAATISAASGAWSPTLVGTSGNDVFQPGYQPGGNRRHDRQRR